MLSTRAEADYDRNPVGSTPKTQEERGRPERELHKTAEGTLGHSISAQNSVVTVA